VGLSDVPSGNLNTTQNTALVNAATKLQALISDRTDFAVLTPGSRERFTLLNALNAADINSGTLGLWGQAARFLTQFKSFSVATITKTLSRDIQDSSSASEAAISVSAFLSAASASITLISRARTAAAFCSRNARPLRTSAIVHPGYFASKAAWA
jgi:hypothetical protein